MATAESFLGVAPAQPSAAAFLGAPPPRTTPAAASPWNLDLITQHAGPGQISSARRSAATNARVGGSPTSSHLTGSAFDFVPQDRDTARAAKALANAGIPYDQILDEGDHVHIGWGPKMRGQYKPRGGVQKAIDFLGANVKRVGTNLATDYEEAQRGARNLMTEGATQFLEGQSEGDAGDIIAGGAKAVGGGIGYLASPVTGLVTNVAGRPVEAATGGRIPRQAVGEAATTALSFLVGGPKPKTAAAPVVEYKPFRATKAERAAAAAEARPVLSAEAFLDTPAVVNPKNPARIRRPGEMAAKVEDPMDDILVAPGRRAGTLSLPEPGAPVPPKGIKEGLTDAASAVQSILAPATKGEGRTAAGTIRRAAAESDLLAARSARTLVAHAQKVAELPVPDQRALIGYIEGRSLGAELPEHLKPFQKTADDIRKVNESYRSRIEEVMGNDLESADQGPAFIRDYYTHLWQNAPGDVERAMASRQGSGKNLKMRSIPTYAEGIEAGLTPVTENPIEATMLYSTNMSRYLATVDAQTALAADNLTAWAPRGGQPQGWVELKGIRTQKPGRYIIQDGETVAMHPEQRLYAEPDAARVYNNWISSGFDASDAKGLFNPIRKATNGMTMLKLGLSAFHATTMAQEGMISEIARGIGAASRGDLATAGKALAGSPAAPVTRYLRGDRMTKELLGETMPRTEMDAAVNDAYIRAGGRVRMDPLLRTRGAGSFYNGIVNGTWKSELKQTAERIWGKEGGVRAADRAMGVVDAAANLIQTTAAPLFEHYIPRLKQGAFASNMADWFAAHPGATQAQIDEAAALINRSIDNRFGEMAWDNLFWHRYLKQASQMTLLSPTWNLGTINEIGGGLLDAMGPSAKGLMKGEGISQRTAYVIALAAYVPLINGIATYLKTGQPPKDMDYLVYRTGGTDATSGEPERALLPGYQKDVFATAYDFPNHIGQEVQNKLNPALSTALQLASNKDYRGLPIYPQDGAMPMPGDNGIDDYLLEQFMPISMGQLKRGDKVGSNISPVEKALAIRPAPAYLQSPERVERLKQLRNRKDWERKRRADQRERARRGLP